MNKSYSNKDQPPLVSASIHGGGGSGRRRRGMTREERLAKLQRNGMAMPDMGGQKHEARDFEKLAAKPLLSKPIDLAESLSCRGKNYIRLD